MRGRRLGAIMFTDVVGYTSMSSRDEGVALALLGRYRTLMQAVFPRYGGRVVKTLGDGFLLEFVSAVEAVNCAVEAQKEMGRLNSALGADEKIPVRIGIHVGDIVHSGEDVLGDVVNVASRVQPLADPGGICVTRQVVDQVEGKVLWQMATMGMRELHNLPNPVEVFRIETEEGAPTPGRRSGRDRHRVAILPFANLSPDPDDRYFADGMTEELISTVSKIRELSVISRASAMRYKETALSRAQVGQELDVEAILEGSVRKAGNKVRIGAQLIEVEADKYVWSQSYDRDLTDVFGVQAEIAQKMAEALKVELLSRDRDRLEARATDNPEAYTFYLKGRFFWNQRTEEGVRRAVKYFEKALTVDPGFAKAYSGLADSYLILADYGWMYPAKAGDLAKENAKRALEIDGSLPEAHASLGLEHVQHDWDFIEGEKELKLAIELNPNYVPAYHWYGVLLLFLRRYGDSIQTIRRALDLDPYSSVVTQSLGVSLLAAGRYEEAVEKFAKVLEESPELPSAHYWMGLANIVQGRFSDAIEEARREVAVDRNDLGARLDLAYAYSEAGQKDEGSRILEDVLAEKEAYVSPCSVGLVLLSLGRAKEGEEWLKKAFEQRDSSLLYFRSLPAYRKHHAYPGWTEIEKGMRFPTDPLTSPI